MAYKIYYFEFLSNNKYIIIFTLKKGVGYLE
jgi:hypothetical protein